MQKIKIDDLLAFTRQLSYLVKMKFPLDESLKYIGKESSSPALRETLEIIDGRVQKGEPFSKSLSSFRNTFFPLYQKMIEIGESTDSLDRILAQLADYLEFNRKIIKEVKAALAYPFAAFTFILLEIFLIVNFCLPSFYDFFGGMNLTLPLPSKLVLSFMNIYIHWHLGWLLVAFIALLNCWNFIPGIGGDQLRLALPFIGKLFKATTYAAFARSMALLLAARIPLHEALEFAEKGMDNKVTAQEIGKLRDAVSRGSSLADALAGCPYFSTLFTWMVSCGEAREELPEVMMEISEYYEKEARTSIKASLGILEPLALILLGMVVGGFVLAFFLPLYQLIGSM